MQQVPRLVLPHGGIGSDSQEEVAPVWWAQATGERQFWEVRVGHMSTSAASAPRQPSHAGAGDAPHDVPRQRSWTAPTTNDVGGRGGCLKG